MCICTVFLFVLNRFSLFSLGGHGWKDIKRQNLQLQSLYPEISIYIKIPILLSHANTLPCNVIIAGFFKYFAKLSNYGKVQQANQVESFYNFCGNSFSPTIAAKLEKQHTLWTPFLVKKLCT